MMDMGTEVRRRWDDQLIIIIVPQQQLGSWKGTPVKYLRDKP